VLIAAAGAALTVTTARAESPVTIAAPGVWTLARLGYGEQTFRVRPDIERQRTFLRYRLPPGAHQGERTWYLLRLHFHIRFRGDSGNGAAYVSAATGSPRNPGYSAQIRFDVRRTESGLVITSDSLGMVAGHQVRTTKRRAIDVRFANYMPYAGVRPGPNVLMVQVEQYQHAAVESLTLYADSAVELTRAGPARLDLGARLRPRLARVGRPATLELQLVNRGGSRTEPIDLSLRYQPGAVRTEKPVMRRLRPLAAGARTTVALQLVALRPGTHRVSVGAVSGLSHPEVTVLLRAVSAETTGTTRRKWWAIGFAGGLALLAAGVAVHIARGRTR
jgi:hypothetical protein